MTIDDRLSEVEGHPTGFDYLRLLLSSAVIAWHTIVTSYGPDVQNDVQASWWRPLSTCIVPMFIALSGFLVAGSLQRSRSLFGFLGLRVLRIYPGLIGVTLFSALLVGPVFTQLPIGRYFADAKFASYLLTALGEIRVQLPGVFLANPNPDRINGQLWTLPFELFCYVTLAGFALIGLPRRRGLFLLATGALCTLILGAYAYRLGSGTARTPSGVPGYSLIIFFLCGVSAYLFRDRLPWSRRFAAGALVLAALCFEWPLWGDFIAAVPIAYLTVYLGCYNPAKPAWLQGKDLSYGIFLYGYVVQQAWMSLSPALHHWWWNFLLAWPTTALLAALSWFWIEKPALSLRRYLKHAENRWLHHRTRFIGHVTRGQLTEPERIVEVER